MIRMILFVVVGLLAGLGAGTGFAVMRAKSAFASESARHAKVVADSLAEHAEQIVTKSASEKAAPEATSDSMSQAEPVAGEPIDAKTETTKATKANSTLATSHKPTTPATGVKVEPKVTPPTSGGTHAPVAGADPVTRALVTSAASKGEDGQPKRISKIFAAMPPKDAAKVLVQMDDADVHLILDALGEKQAAAILQNFPADRLAAFTKAAIRGSRTP
ncbi:MAG: hypothetical protein ABI877_01980 [Gemmatimonadaceae bacterium]